MCPPNFFSQLKTSSREHFRALWLLSYGISAKMCCKHRLYIIFIYSLRLQEPNFRDSLCYQQTVKMSAQGGVLALALVLVKGKAEALRESGRTRWSVWVHEILRVRQHLREYHRLVQELKLDRSGSRRILFIRMYEAIVHVGCER